MGLQIGDVAPDFEAETTEGRIRFHDWIGDSWGVLFSHPKDFTPVCTTELGYMAKIKPEFDRRNVKVIGLSVDPVENHKRWSRDIEETQGHAPNYPMIGDTDLSVSKKYGMLPAALEGTCDGRTAADNQTVRNVFVIGPDKKIKLVLDLPDDDRPQLRRSPARHRFAAADREAQGRDARQLEARRGRDHRRLGLGRRGEDQVPGRLEGAAAVSADRAAAEGLSLSPRERRDPLPFPSTRRWNRCWRSSRPELPAGRLASSTSRSGTAFAPLSFAARPRFTSRAASSGRSTGIFPSCTRRCWPSCRLAASRRRNRHRDQPRARLRCAADAAASRRVTHRQTRQGHAASFVAFDLLAADGRDLRDMPQAERRARLEQLLADTTPPVHLTPVTRDRADRCRMAERFEGAGLDGVVAKPLMASVSAGQTRDVQDQARAHRRLRRRRLPLAQERDGRGRLAAAWPLRRPRRSAPRRCDVSVHDGEASRVGGRARATAKERPRSSIPGASGPARPARSTRCPAARAAGAPARICRGSRYGSSASAR